MPAQIITRDAWVRFWQNAVGPVTARGVLIVGLILGYVIVRAVVFRVLDAGVAGLAARQQREGAEAEQTNRLRTLQVLGKNLAGYVLLFILIIMVLDAVGANVSGIIATAGVGGLAIGFGAQKLVGDVISGFFFIIEDQYVVGDYVTIGTA